MAKSSARRKKYVSLNFPQDCNNTWVRLKTTTNQLIWFFPLDMRYSTNQSMVYGYVSAPQFLGSDCTIGFGEDRQLIPPTCLNQWRKLYLKNYDTIWFYPTDITFETSNKVILGWLYSTDYRDVICETPTGIVDISGEWDTEFGKLSLTQDGNQVSGEYTFNNGTLQGTLTGNILSANWQEGDRSGTCLFEFSKDVDSFLGGWNHEEADPINSWDGKRA